MTMTIRHTMKMTIRRLQWTVREFGRDWTNWLNMCFLPSPTCASNIEQSHFLSAGGFNFDHSVIFGDDGGHNGNDDEDRRSRAWNTGFWILKRIAQGKVKQTLCVSQSLSCQDNPGELHDVHHVRVGLVRDWSTFFKYWISLVFFNPSSLIHSIWCAITTLFSALNSPISLCLSGNVFRIPTNTAARVKARQYLPTLATLSSSSSSSSY